MQIRRRKRRQVPGLNMASMPDLIFTVLFFFMIVTHMRNETVQVKYTVPQGTEVSKPINRHTAMNIYIGHDKHGDTRIQVDDKVCYLQQVAVLVQRHQQSLGEEQEDMIVNLRVDRNIPMGVVNEVKQELRKAGALKIRYTASEKKEGKK